jgi:hypothetical protein
MERNLTSTPRTRARVQACRKNVALREEPIANKTKAFKRAVKGPSVAWRSTTTRSTKATRTEGVEARCQGAFCRVAFYHDEEHQSHQNRAYPGVSCFAVGAPIAPDLALAGGGGAKPAARVRLVNHGHTRRARTLARTACRRAARRSISRGRQA